MIKEFQFESFTVFFEKKSSGKDNWRWTRSLGQNDPVSQKRVIAQKNSNAILPNVATSTLPMSFWTGKLFSSLAEKNMKIIDRRKINMKLFVLWF